MFIEANLSDPDVDAHSICRAMGMSRTVLYSKLRTLTGQSVHEFIKSVRLEHSLRLLHEGVLSINQIAFEVGFNSHSYFDRCFVKQYGIGPREYCNREKALLQDDTGTDYTAKAIPYLNRYGIDNAYLN
jgi:AraC-like DNA-binding protein